MIIAQGKRGTSVALGKQTTKVLLFSRVCRAPRDKPEKRRAALGSVNPGITSPLQSIIFLVLNRGRVCHAPIHDLLAYNVIAAAVATNIRRFVLTDNLLDLFTNQCSLRI